MKQIKIKAPAKLNLFLHILRKRPDRYHDLFSLFHRLKLSDELTFRKIPSETCRIVSKIKGFPTGRTNLIAKTFWLLKEKTGFKGGVEVRIKKQIPIGAGLGGGSSDCAATLIALNRLFHLGLKHRELQKFGKKLGADVPFFLQPAKSALISGVGDRIRPYSKVGKFHLLLIVFPKPLSTKVVYQALSLTPQKSSVKIPRFFAELRTLETLKRYFRNDLMVASFKLYPQVRKVFEYLKKNDYLASQTGSGPTLFVADRTPARLRILARKVSRLFNVKTQLTLSL